MLFSKPKAALVLKRNCIELTQGETTVRLDLPSEIFYNLDVYQPDKLKEMVGQFATQNDLDGRSVVIILDGQITFQKNLPLTNSVSQEAEIQDFKSKVPFELDNRAILKITNRDWLILVGANRSYFEIVKQAVEERGASVVAVTPIENSDSANIATFLNGSNLSNFLEVKNH